MTRQIAFDPGGWTPQRAGKIAELLARVLRPGGAVGWVSSLGLRTPIYLEPLEVLEALGPGWNGVTSAWGESTWCVARR